MRWGLAAYTIVLLVSPLGCGSGSTSPEAETGSEATDVTEGEEDESEASDSNADTTESDTGDATDTTDTTDSTDTTTGEGDPPVLLVGFSIHLEGWDVSNPAVYDQYTGRIRELAEDAADAGARLTFEASDDLSTAVLDRGDTLYADLLELGHGVEVHADLGYAPNLATLSQAGFEADMLAYRERAIAAGATADHVSGVCSHLDWVQATLAAGYTGLGGTVSYCWMAAPERQRPPQYADCPDPATCHDAWPEAFDDRLSPWRIGAVDTWDVHDPEGELLLIPTATGLTCLEEAAGGQGAGEGCFLTQEDIDLWTADLDAAITLLDPGRINTLKGTFSMGAPVDATLMQGVWDAAQTHVLAGDAAWATLADIQTAFEANE